VRQLVVFQSRPVSRLRYTPSWACTPADPTTPPRAGGSLTVPRAAVRVCSAGRLRSAAAAEGEAEECEDESVPAAREEEESARRGRGHAYDDRADAGEVMEELTVVLVDSPDSDDDEDAFHPVRASHARARERERLGDGGAHRGARGQPGQ
jgi:hypothetical protein